MALQWVAWYSDNTFLTQFNEDGTENKYSDIDRTKLSEFRLHHEGSGSLVFSQYFEEDQRLIYRKRTSMRSDGAQASFYMVGWQMTIGDRNLQSISYIHESGTPVLVAGKFNEDHPLFYAIEPVESELNDIYST